MKIVTPLTPLYKQTYGFFAPIKQQPVNVDPNEALLFPAAAAALWLFISSRDGGAGRGGKGAKTVLLLFHGCRNDALFKKGSSNGDN